MSEQKESETKMSETKTANTIARERVDNLANRNSEPAWLRELRLSAWEAYLQTPMPTSRTEEWRKVEIESLDLSALKTIDMPATVAESKPVGLPRWFDRALGAFTERAGAVVQTNQHAWTQLSEEAASKGIIFCTMRTAIVEHHDLVRPYLERKCQDDDKFGLMNKALFNSGAFLYVPPNVELQGTLFNLVHLSAEAVKQGVAVFPRILVIAGANSRVNFACCFSTEEIDGPEALPESLSNAVVDIHVAAGARVNYLELLNFGSKTFAVARNHGDVSRDGFLYSLSVGLGAGQLKSDIKTSLQAAGAQADIEGVVLGNGNEHYSFNTSLDHNAPDTKSNINFRVALKDAASSVYLGTIRVAKAAQRTDATQSNKNLLLGSEAKADSIPKLEILADDVKCSHGATVGPVDKEQLFYLMSRGLPPTMAEELIVTGFFRKIFDTCTISGAKEFISTLIGDKVHS